jgi:hypothetical protein
LENAIGNDRIGGLRVARKFPPSLRGRVVDSLGSARIRDLFYQMPIMALWPRAVAAAAAGEKLKDVAEGLGLPKSVRRVHAKSGGPYRMVVTAGGGRRCGHQRFRLAD